MSTGEVVEREEEKEIIITLNGIFYSAATTNRVVKLACFRLDQFDLNAAYADGCHGITHHIHITRQKR